MPLTLEPKQNNEIKVIYYIHEGHNKQATMAQIETKVTYSKPYKLTVSGSLNNFSLVLKLDSVPADTTATGRESQTSTTRP